MTKYFVYCEDCGFEDFENEELATAKAEEHIEHYLDNDAGWDECVEGVVMGVVTHQATQCNVKKKPLDLDEDNVSASTGEYWEHGDEFDYICSYQMNALKGE